MKCAKPSTCKVCKAKYIKTRPLQTVCTPLCAMEHAKAQASKKAVRVAMEERKEVKSKLDSMKTKPQLFKLAQQAFNTFIRARDAGKPCICCGKPLGSEPNSFDAGHYRSVGSAPHMRFVEDNVHGQLKHCNNYLAGNHVAYRAGLIERIGLARVEQIESDNAVRKYTHEGLRELAKQYREMTKLITKGIQ